MTTFKALPVNIRTDAAFQITNEKNKKSRPVFPHLPIETAALVFLAVIFSFFSLVGSSQAASPSPAFTIHSNAQPTNFSPAQNAECLSAIANPVISSALFYYCDSYLVAVTNAGSELTDGSVSITDTVPSGLTIKGLELYGTALHENSEGIGADRENTRKLCVFTGQVVRCTFPGTLAPDQKLELLVFVTVDEPVLAPALTNKAEVSGGGASSVSAESSNEVNASPAAFGISNFEFLISGLNGARDTRAGDHPYELTTTFELNSVLREVRGGGGQGQKEVYTAAGTLRDIVVDLPLGFLGSTEAAAECPLSQMSSEKHCPPDTIVGELTTEPQGYTSIESPIYNLVPERGHPAEFGYVDALKTAHTLYTQVVPTPHGYVLQTSANEITEVNLRRIVATFYGDPSEKQAELQQHERESKLIEEGEQKLIKQLKEEHYEGPIDQKLEELREKETTYTKVQRERPTSQVPFFTNPTLCSGGPQVATLYVDSWQDPGKYNPNGTPDLEPNVPASERRWKEYVSESPPVQGCDQVAFTPELKVQPTTNQADSPTGLEFEAKLAQPEAFGTPATSPLKNLTVTFPVGMTVDPSSADGLGTCSESQIGWLGRYNENGEEYLNHGLTNFNPEQPQATEQEEIEGRDGVAGEPARCPKSAKIGVLELESPLIPGKIYGEVYLAAQNANPFNSTFALYVVVNDPITGVVIKIPGELKANPTTGQLTSVFTENPQLPFSILQVHFFGGPRAELATPPNCGTYTTHSQFAPWSIEASELPAEPFSNYVIYENCAIGFNPAFTGGSTNLQAGAYTTFQASFERQDDDQELSGAEVNLPPGLLADISSVTECGATELAAEVADAGTGGCPASSKVGAVESGAGPGPNPLFVPGQVFLTGPYNGHGSCTPGSESACAPYGLAVVVSANPGPFHFGNVVVRQRLFINKETAAVTDVSDPFPTYLDPVGLDGQTNGIPIKLRRVDVEINRPGFAFNPTNCVKEKYKVGGDITSVSGASKTLATPFQVTNCGHLKFAPSITFSTNGKTSKADGADLITKVTYPKAAQGIYSDIGYVKVELPKALPSRLTTLQRACTLKQFELNPAGCPSEADIGHVTVHTPILPGALTGPAIFVSHGGEAFPTLTMVLQGDGVTIDLVGNTFISKAGVTSTTFKTVPDSPFETFELVLPQGPYSALAANGNLCTQQLVIPNEWNAQDGTPLKEDSVVNVTGCKPAIYVTKHTVKGRTATISVKVPSAGHLTASARGLTAPSGAGRATKSAKGAMMLTVKLSLTNAEAAFLKKHKGRKLEAKIHLTFTQKKGAKLKASTTVDIG
jgi:hypothetical protein